jgi:hypothetical protein
MFWATFWAIFFTNSSGHTGGEREKNLASKVHFEFGFLLSWDEPPFRDRNLLKLGSYFYSRTV